MAALHVQGNYFLSVTKIFTIVTNNYKVYNGYQNSHKMHLLFVTCILHSEDKTAVQWLSIAQKQRKVEWGRYGREGRRSTIGEAAVIKLRMPIKLKLGGQWGDEKTIDNRKRCRKSPIECWSLALNILRKMHNYFLTIKMQESMTNSTAF